MTQLQLEKVFRMHSISYLSAAVLTSQYIPGNVIKLTQSYGSEGNKTKSILSELVV